MERSSEFTLLFLELELYDISQVLPLQSGTVPYRNNPKNDMYYRQYATGPDVIAP